MEALKAAARQRLAAGQGELDLGPDVASAAGPLEIVSSRMADLWDALCRAYRTLGIEAATGADPVFRALVLARIIEPTSRRDSPRVLAEVGADPVAYRTIERRLSTYSTESWRHSLAAACAAHTGLGPASLVLYDVSTLTSRPTPATGSASLGSPRSAASKPQITIGMLTDASGFPLMVEAFEGNKAETATMLPVIKAFMAAPPTA